MIYNKKYFKANIIIFRLLSIFRQKSRRINWRIKRRLKRRIKRRIQKRIKKRIKKRVMKWMHMKIREAVEAILAYHPGLGEREAETVDTFKCGPGRFC